MCHEEVLSLRTTRHVAYYGNRSWFSDKILGPSTEMSAKG